MFLFLSYSLTDLNFNFFNFHTVFNNIYIGYGVPSNERIKDSYNVLTDYLNNLDRVLADLKIFLNNIVKNNFNFNNNNNNNNNNNTTLSNNNNNNNTKTTSQHNTDMMNMNMNTLIIMTCNKGQSIMFRNFVCNARAKGLDLSRIIMFATDIYTVKLSNELGIHTYYDEAIFGTMPEDSAKRYGDIIFSKMMMAKVYCVHLTLSLNYNILYQDVDIIWNTNPLSYLLSENLNHWDMMFQDDGSRQSRFAPYSPNSGTSSLSPLTNTQPARIHPALPYTACTHSQQFNSIQLYFILFYTA
jgi:hypothetical protein